MTEILTHEIDANHIFCFEGKVIVLHADKYEELRNRIVELEAQLIKEDMCPKCFEYLSRDVHGKAWCVQCDWKALGGDDVN